MYYFNITYFDDDNNEHFSDCRKIISVIEINRDLNDRSQRLLIPHRSIHFWRTNLPADEFSMEDIIHLYKDHGTSEQFHSEFKSDLDLERLPSSKFNTNQLWLQLSKIA